MDKKNYIGDYIKNLRLKEGYKTQKQLSDLSGISQTTLSRIEAGSQKPLPDTLAILSRYLRSVSYGELMEKVGYMTGLSEKDKGYVLEFFESHQQLDKDLEDTIQALSKTDAISSYFPCSIIQDIKCESQSILHRFNDIDFEFTPDGIRKVLKELDPDLDFKSELLGILNRVKIKHAQSLSRKGPNIVDIYKRHANELKNKLPHSVPLLGKIRCGVPLLDEANWDEQIELPGSIKADFAARAEGDSMIYAGIHPGDVILFRENAEPYNGQVVATRHANEAEGVNLKYFINKNGQALLRSANPEYEDIKLNGNHQIIGIMVGLIREDPPSLHEYESMLSVKSDAEDRWTETIVMATANGITPEDIQNIIKIQVNLAFNLAKNKI